jgi:hypothetical protein
VWRVQIHAKVAQLVEHSTENAGVVGSIPSLGTKTVKQGRKLGMVKSRIQQMCKKP